ncbi:MAG: HD domain-containing protein [Christensenellaceae bacterium]|jgi:hypothetical protein|nr:HD domain-containing protein [Christensenellaceae bacterium]
MTKEIDYKKEYLDLFKQIKREGAAELLEYIEKTNFFSSPASTRFHSNFEGGLVEHCVKVYHRFVKLLTAEYGEDYLKDEKRLETATVIALLHDLCKVDTYKTEMRNQKIDGAWVQVPFYAVDDKLPYGHGEKSVYMVCGFMKLSREEAMAINWHMGAYDSRADYGNALGQAFKLYPIALLFHIADNMSSYLDEKTV